jgi:hypothetical protein
MALRLLLRDCLPSCHPSHKLPISPPSVKAPLGAVLCILDGRRLPIQLRARVFPHPSRTVPQCLPPRAIMMLVHLRDSHLQACRTAQLPGRPLDNIGLRGLTLVIIPHFLRSTAVGHLSQRQLLVAAGPRPRRARMAYHSLASAQPNSLRDP